MTELGVLLVDTIVIAARFMRVFFLDRIVYFIRNAIGICLPYTSSMRNGLTNNIPVAVAYTLTTINSLFNMFITAVLYISKMIISSIIYSARRVTNGCLSAVRIFVGPAYRRGIDSLYRALDRGYRSSLPGQLQDIDNELERLRDATDQNNGIIAKLLNVRNTDHDLRKLEKHMKDLRKVLEQAFGKARGDESKGKVDESASIWNILGEFIPGVNLAFLALRPLFNVLERDERVRALVNKTVVSIGSLVKELGTLQRRAAQEDINLNAAELEELRVYLKMIRDGLDVIRRVLQERQSFRLAFGRADRHQSDLESWNRTVRIMLEDQDRQHRHMIYYRTRLILQTSKLNLLVSAVNLTMIIFVVFYLQTVLEILLDIRKQLQPFYKRLWNHIQEHLKKLGEEIEEHLN